MTIESVMPFNHLSSVIPFFSRLQSFPASGSFQMSQLFASGGQSIRVSASASVLPMSIQNWFPLGWTGWIYLQPKGLSRIFSNITVQKHQFFGAQLSLWSNSDIHTYICISRINLHCCVDGYNLFDQSWSENVVSLQSFTSNVSISFLHIVLTILGL